MANTLKTPAITKTTKILSFDLESNGLHGDAFAVAAVVIDASGEVYDEFGGRAEIVGTTDEWVEKNVLPVIANMPVEYSDYKQMRSSFWSWFVRAQQQSDYVLVQNGYPVEYRFLIQCQEDDMQSRYWQHPFPILDLTSMAIQARQDLKVLKSRVARDHATILQGNNHNPMYDAKVAALMAFELINLQLP